MPYSQFTIEQIKNNFGIIISEQFGIFADIPEINYSDFFAQSLKEYLPLALAIDTEKARSELIVMPILVEIKRQLASQISIFSGKDFTVDVTKGLNGFCDFLISLSSEQIFIEAPVVTLVEAKNDNIQSGLAQCMAEMIAAQIFNEVKENQISTIYGVVTTGTNWRFLRLEGKTIEIDFNEYFISQVGKILGILKSTVMVD
ncbi:MAG: hypothetical protein KME30_08655 [Iphinoe sp. HA4291-MV1]|jgi:hypothetical protein|nr:hypothetical protein [Iphinoe sp. HA4291-MV1]